MARKNKFINGFKKENITQEDLITCDDYSIDLYKQLTSNDLEYFISMGKKINWQKAGFLSILSEDFIRKYIDKLDWGSISKQQLSLEFIMEFKDKLTIILLCNHQKNINKKFINIFKNEIFKNEFGVNYLLQNEYISEEMIEYLNSIKPFTNNNWCEISIFQNHISIEFVEKYKDKLNWKILSSNRCWTIKELKKYKEYIILKELRKNQYLYDIIFEN